MFSLYANLLGLLKKFRKKHLLSEKGQRKRFRSRQNAYYRSVSSVSFLFQVPDEKCPDLKPPSRESCNTDDCPQWFAGIWSEVRITLNSPLVEQRKQFSNNNIVIRGLPKLFAL